jgi:uncharacterized protein
MESIFVKVALLLTMSLLSGAAGTWCGRNIKSLGACIGLGIAFLVGCFGVFMAAHAGPAIGIPALLAWTFLSGLFIGPVVGQFSEEFGWNTVGGIFAGTSGVMAVCGMIGLFSGVDFSGMGSYLMFALFGLIIAGVIGIFVRMSRTTNIIYHIMGMIIFSGYFIFDFFRLGHTDDTWEKAIQMTMSLYLDFLNFFLHALQLYSQLHHK